MSQEANYMAEIPGTMKYFDADQQRAYDTGVRHGKQMIFETFPGVEKEFPLGITVETTGETYMKGVVIGHYTTLEGHDGCVIQVLDCDNAKRIVHVNRNKYLRRVA